MAKRKMTRAELLQHQNDMDLINTVGLESAEELQLRISRSKAGVTRVEGENIPWAALTRSRLIPNVVSVR